MKDKLGKFSISNDMLKNIGSHKNIMRLFGRMIIVRAEQHFEKDTIEYVAMSDYFKKVKKGEKITSYHFVFSNGDIECKAL